MNEPAEAQEPADCLTVTEARLRMALIEQAGAIEAIDSMRADLLATAMGATVH